MFLKKIINKSSNAVELKKIDSQVNKKKLINNKISKKSQLKKANIKVNKKKFVSLKKKKLINKLLKARLLKKIKLKIRKKKFIKNFLTIKNKRFKKIRIIKRFRRAQKKKLKKFFKIIFKEFRYRFRHQKIFRKKIFRQKKRLLTVKKIFYYKQRIFKHLKKWKFFSAQLNNRKTFYNLSTFFYKNIKLFNIKNYLSPIGVPPNKYIAEYSRDFIPKQYSLEQREKSLIVYEKLVDKYTQLNKINSPQFRNELRQKIKIGEILPPDQKGQNFTYDEFFIYYPSTGKNITIIYLINNFSIFYSKQTNANYPIIIYYSRKGYRLKKFLKRIRKLKKKKKYRFKKKQNILQLIEKVSKRKYTFYIRKAEQNPQYEVIPYIGKPFVHIKFRKLFNYFTKKLLRNLPKVIIRLKFYKTDPQQTAIKLCRQFRWLTGRRYRFLKFWSYFKKSKFKFNKRLHYLTVRNKYKKSIIRVRQTTLISIRFLFLKLLKWLYSYPKKSFINYTLKKRIYNNYGKNYFISNTFIYRKNFKFNLLNLDKLW